jgi:hypothetical protein
MEPWTLLISLLCIPPNTSAPEGAGFCSNARGGVVAVFSFGEGDRPREKSICNRGYLTHLTRMRQEGDITF